MIPSLAGRLQTRVFVMLVIGIPWTIVITPVLPMPTDAFGTTIPLGDQYEVTVTAWALALVFGLGWELVYHAWQQRRWDRDFPSLYFGLASLWEFIPVAAVVLSAYDPPFAAIFIMFFGLWLLIWLFIQGPIRVVLPRWRFRGGRVLVTVAPSPGSAGDVAAAIAEGRQQRREQARRRERLSYLVPAVITVIWAIAITALGWWPRLFDRWPATITMVFGGFVAGSTPQGGGAVAFPVFTKVLHTPSEVARSMGLFIQTIGMGSASLALIIRRAPIAWHAVGLVLGPAVAGLAIAFFGASRIDEPFAPSTLPGPWVKVAFTILIVAMAATIFAMSRRPLRERRATLGNLNPRAKALIIGAGLLGGFLSGLTGSGADVLLFTVLVLLLGLDPRVGVPSSVIVMAVVSAVAFVSLGLVAGHLFVELDQDRTEVVAVSGDPIGLEDGIAVYEPSADAGTVPPEQYDLTGLWLAGIPAAAWAAPFGAKLAMRLSDRNLAWLVAGLAFAEMISTAIFLDALRTDLALLAFFVLGIVGAVLGLRWASNHRHRLFGLEPWDRSKPVTRMSVITSGSFSSWAQQATDTPDEPEQP